MKRKHIWLRIIFTAIIPFCLFCSCEKYLAESPNSDLVIPSTAEDLRAILDNNARMNERYSILGAIASDDYFLSDNSYNSLSVNPLLNYYNWGMTGEPTDQTSDWFNGYTRIYYANTVLDNLNNVELEEMKQSDLKIMKGEALFFRAVSHFQMDQIYSLPYNPKTANETLGIPLRLTSNFNIKSNRPNQEIVYQQIIKDLVLAEQLLPTKNYNLLRPNKIAAFAALSNISLVMQNFKNAEKYADSCLELKHILINYNDIDSSADIRFPLFNKEIIWYAEAVFNTIARNPKALVDSDFYNSYDKFDLRKKLFFQKQDTIINFIGNYNGTNNINYYFSGFAVDEVYLVKAEAEARLNKIPAALETINTLTKNRFSRDSYSPYSSDNQNEVLNYILDIRRKELCFRRICRWVDIRRLNELNGTKIIPKRIINGKTYQLNPGDLHYAFLLPDAAINFSDIPQNMRQ